MGFYRKIQKELQEWKDSPFRKPLVLRGARQTGKTTVINQFSKEFDTYIYLNPEKESDKKLFENNKNIKEIFQMICFEKNISPKGKTLLFIDEIQNSSNAVMQMRYFFEELPEIFVIGAGSLLEIMMDVHKISFPVGRVEYKYLFPMTFEEFLLAMEENQAIELLNSIPIPSFAHKKMLELFRLYIFVGGMPEAVLRYKETKDFLQVAKVYNSLISSYKDDVSKYAKNTNETTIIRHVIETVPFEVGNRITFENFGNSGYKSKEVSSSLRTLERAMILYLRYPITAATIPLFPDFKLKPHLQFLDSGLMNHALKITGLYYKDDSLSEIYNGRLAEQIVGQEIIANSTNFEIPLFWTREKKQSNAEVDFLTIFDGEVIPIEVKSGKAGTLKSLHSFVDNSEVKIAVRLFSGEYSVEENITPIGRKPYKLINIPLYCVSKINEYLSKL